MPGFDEFMLQFRQQAAKVLDPDASTVGIEIDAMDWQFSELVRLITDLERHEDKTARECAAKLARMHLNTLVQRAYRAKLIAGGQRITKST